MSVCKPYDSGVKGWANEETQSYSTSRWGDRRILCYGHSGALLDSTQLQEERNWPSLLLFYVAPILECLSSLPIFFPSWLKCLTSMSRFCNNQIPQPNYSGTLTHRVPPCLLPTARSPEAEQPFLFKLGCSVLGGLSSDKTAHRDWSASQGACMKLT